MFNLTRHLLVLAVLLTSTARLSASFTIWATTPGENLESSAYPIGSNVRIESNADTATPATAYQWFHNGDPINGATAPQLDLGPISAANAGNYRLQVSVGSRTEFSNTTVVINVPPVVPRVVDTSFTAPDDLPTQDYTSPPAEAGRVLAVTSQGRVLTTAAPFPFDREANALPLNLPADFDATATLYEADVCADGRFYLRQGNHLARFAADGTIDATFSFQAPSTAHVESVKLDFSERPLVILRYPNYERPDDYTYGRDASLRLLPDGSADPAFFGPRTSILYTHLTLYPLVDGRTVVYEVYHGYSSLYLIRANGTMESSVAAANWVSTEAPQVDPVRGLIYFLPSSPAFSSSIIRYRVTESAVELDGTFFLGYQRPRDTTYALDAQGYIYAYGGVYSDRGFDSWEGHPTTNIARLLPEVTMPGGPLRTVSMHGNNSNVTRGGEATFTTTVRGSGPFTYQWIALDGQPLPADTTSPTLTITDVQPEHLGRYQLRVTGPGGTRLSEVVTVAANSSVAALSNLSGRAVPGDGEANMVVGFSVQRASSGTPNFYMLRGVGPSLADHGIASPVADPSLRVFSADEVEIAANDNWTDDSYNRSQIIGRSAQFGAFALRDPSLDAGLQVGVQQSGQLTVHLNRTPGDEGPALLEIYEIADYADRARPATLVNLSLRAQTGPGDATAVAGFVLTDPLGYNRPVRVLMRAIGPSLSGFGIAQPLPDPVMTLHDASGAALATVDNWGDDNEADALADTMAQVGAFTVSRDSLDSALVLELRPGAYTLTVADSEQRTGIVIMEIYLVL